MSFKNVADYFGFGPEDEFDDLEAGLSEDLDLEPEIDHKAEIDALIDFTNQRGDRADAAIKRTVALRKAGGILAYGAGVGVTGLASGVLMPGTGIIAALGGVISATAGWDAFKAFRSSPKYPRLPDETLPPGIGVEIFRQPQEDPLLFLRLPNEISTIPPEARSQVYRDALSQTSDRLADIDYSAVAVPVGFMLRAGMAMPRYGERITTRRLFADKKAIEAHGPAEEKNVRVFSKEEFEALIEQQDVSLLHQLLDSLSARHPSSMTALINASEEGVNHENLELLRKDLRRIINRHVSRDSETTAELNHGTLVNGTPKTIKTSSTAELRSDNGELQVFWMKQNNSFVDRKTLLSYLGFKSAEELLSTDFDRLPARDRDIHEAFAAFLLTNLLYLPEPEVDNEEVVTLTDEELAIHRAKLRPRGWPIRFDGSSYDEPASINKRSGLVGRMIRRTAFSTACIILYFGSYEALNVIDEIYFDPPEAQQDTPTQRPGVSAPQTDTEQRGPTDGEKDQELRDEFIKNLRVLTAAMGLVAVGGTIAARKHLLYEYYLRRQQKDQRELATGDPALLKTSVDLLNWVAYGYPRPPGRPASLGNDRGGVSDPVRWLERVELQLSPDGATDYLEAPHIYDSSYSANFSFAQRRTNLRLATLAKRAHTMRELEEKLTK